MSFIDTLLSQGIAALRLSYQKGDVTPPQVNAFCRAKTRRLNEQLHAVTQLTREACASFDKTRPLSGIPILVKDIINIRQLTSTAGSIFLNNIVPEEDAPAVAALREAGANIMGKTTLSELSAYLSTTLPPGYSERFAQGVNALNPLLSPGGSSSGSAIAVAAGLCAGALGTESNGSIVIPAAANGVVGFKPSVGLISTLGVIPIAHTVDTIGVITRNVRDAAELVLYMAGFGKMTPYSRTENEIARWRQHFCQARTIHRVGLYRSPALRRSEAADKLLRQTADFFATQSIECERVSLADGDWGYKTFSAYEIRGDMNAYLKEWGKNASVHSFDELVQAYEKTSHERPYGCDRLTYAASKSGDLNAPEYLNAIENGVSLARETVRHTLDQRQLDILVGVGYQSIWAISGSPSLSVPLGLDEKRHPISLFVAGRDLDDIAVIEGGKILEKIARAFRT